MVNYVLRLFWLPNLTKKSFCPAYFHDLKKLAVGKLDNTITKCLDKSISSKTPAVKNMDFDYFS